MCINDDLNTRNPKGLNKKELELMAKRLSLLKKTKIPEDKKKRRSGK